MNELQLNKISLECRLSILDMVYNAKSGHIGSSFSCVELLCTLYFKILRYNSQKPTDIDRDRFILSKGHAAPALYYCLAKAGFFKSEELLHFREYQSILQGHPDMKSTPGIDMTSGSLGNGISIGTGKAMYGKRNNKAYKIIVLLGDGEQQEGIVWEAAMTASHYNLDNLIVIIDNNGLQINGKVSDIMDLSDVKDKWKSFGWQVFEVDGHDVTSLEKTLNKTYEDVNNRPKVIIANTIKGKGVSFMEHVPSWHSKVPDDLEFKNAKWELESKLHELSY